MDASLISPPRLPHQIIEGLQDARWPGRCQIVEDRQPRRKGTRWFLDGAHTVESLLCCGEWFVEASHLTRYTPILGRSRVIQAEELVARAKERVLVFNCTSGRSAESLLSSLVSAMAGRRRKLGHKPDEARPFDEVIFCTNVTYSSGGYKGGKPACTHVSSG